jgi:hypothetical protein
VIDREKYLARQRRYNRSDKGRQRSREYARRKLGWYDDDYMNLVPAKARRVV